MPLTSAETTAANALLDAGFPLTAVGMVLAIARAARIDPTTVAGQYRAAYADAAKLIDLHYAPVYDATRPGVSLSGGA